MSVHWSSELSKWEFRDLQATCMSVDWSGNNIILAGKRCLAIKQLNVENESSDVIKKIPRQSKYDVAGAEWCQTQQGQRLCAISSNQRVDVYHWRNGELTGIHSLRGHTRVVSDTHWHREDHNLIATCSIDTFTYLWDLRDTRKPVLSLSAVAGASQVQWNKVANHLLATAHDGDVKLWDKRKGSMPIQYISAHLCKIHGLDWSPHHDYQLVTSSHDGTIKYFDINNPRKVENTITTNYPVWRAIYTPFGSGLVTMGVGWGGVTRGDEAGVVGMWVNGALVHRLVGHTDVILQMQWRPNVSPSNYQLFTWARDQTLRLWSMRPSLLKVCSHFLPDDSEMEDDAISETLSYVSTSDLTDQAFDSSDIKMVKLTSHEHHHSLAEEFELAKTLEYTSLTEIDLDRKVCVIKVEVNNNIAILRAVFPNTYPNELSIPKFMWLSGTNIDTSSTIKILQALNLGAHHKVRQNSGCLNHCLKILISNLQQIPVKNKDGTSFSKINETSAQSEKADNAGSGAGDHCVPFPRTCGAKWCGVGILVVFNRPPNAKRMSLKPESSTPRSLSSLSTPVLIVGHYRSLSPHLTTSPSPTNLVMNFLHHRPPSHSITTFYFQDRWKSSTRRSGSGLRSGSMSQFSPKITLYKADQLFFLNKKLAEKYVISNNSVAQMCEYNASVAASVGRLDLMQAWHLSALTVAALEQRKSEMNALSNFSQETENEPITWSSHPFGSNLMQALINHYAKTSDIQMAAMLCCAFSVYHGSYKYEPGLQLVKTSSKSSELSTNSNESGSSPYNTIHNISEISEGWAVPVLRPDHTSSWSDSTELNPSYNESSMQGFAKMQDNASSPNLDTSTVHLYQCIMRAYADILHRWNLLDARAEVMKHVFYGEEVKHSGIELMSECQKCSKITNECRCKICSTIALNCIICNISVRGSANACLVCGHGGHTKHLEEWFSKFDVCPTGCGCRCLQETGNLMER